MDFSPTKLKNGLKTRAIKAAVACGAHGVVKFLRPGRPSGSCYRAQLENWLQGIDVKAETVFDIGGLEYPVLHRVRSWEVKNYLIFDNDSGGPPQESVDASYHYIKFDLNTNMMSQGLNSTYHHADIIFCIEVFDYIYDSMTATKNIYTLLNPNGMAYMSFPFVYPWHKPRDIDYLRYTIAGVKKLLHEAGFRQVEIDRKIDPSGLLETFYRVDGMYYAPDEFANTTGFHVTAVK